MNVPRPAIGRLALLLAGAAWLVPLQSSAHEVRPAYLEMRETGEGQFDVVWKTPMRGDSRLALEPELSGATELLSPVTMRSNGSAAVQTWRLRAIDSLRGQSLRIAGLESTMTDALVRIEFRDGTAWVERLTPRRTSAVIPLRRGAFETARAYLGLGVEHILLGTDHLLFVLALLMLTSGAWRLVKTVTAFTIAHSVTLALATLGVVRVPGPPIEALIALSIVFVAAEILARRRGRQGLAARSPWIVAFGFGLLHGFGFAGALGEAGIPQGLIPVSLLFFNLGVEAGQLLYIGIVSSSIALVRRLPFRLPGWVELAPPYAIGTVAMAWTLQRIAAF